MTVLFNILLKPFSSLHPLWGLMWISALTGFLMVYIFKISSNQQAIGDLRRKMGSRALGMLLYLESPPTVIKLALGLIADNFIYLWHLLRPMLVIAVPFVLIAAQLDARYGRIPPSEDRPSTLIVRWEGLIPEWDALSPEYGVLTSPVVTIEDSLEQSFSFTGESNAFLLSIDESNVKAGTLGGNGEIIYRGADTGGLLRSLLRPWNAPATGSISEVEVFLQPASYSILGGRWSWFAVFLVFSGLWAVPGALILKVKV